MKNKKKGIKMTAQEARKIADNVPNYKQQKVLEDALQIIKESAFKGYYDLILYREIPYPAQLKFDLEQLGFNVSIQPGPTKTYTSISWKPNNEE